MMTDDVSDGVLYTVTLRVFKAGYETALSDPLGLADALHRRYIVIVHANAGEQPTLADHAIAAAARAYFAAKGERARLEAWGALKDACDTDYAVPSAQAADADTELDARDAEMADLRATDDELSARLDALDAQLGALVARIMDLTQHLRALAERGS